MKTTTYYSTTIYNYYYHYCFTALCWYQKTFTHSHLSWSPIILDLIPPSTMIHIIILVQFTCLAVFLHNLCPSPLWSTSQSGTLHFILHTFCHPIIVFFRNTWPYECNLLCCSAEILSSNLSLSLNSTWNSISFTLLHIHLTILISARWSATLFSFPTGQVSLPCNTLLCTQLMKTLTIKQHFAYLTDKN